MTNVRSRSMLPVLLGALLAATALALALSGPAHAAVADVSVRKTTADDRVAVGEAFSWTVRVSNRGPARAEGVRVVDTLPESVRLTNVVSSQGGPCDVDFPRVVCEPGTIASGKTATIRLYVRATEAGTLRNRARAYSSTTDANASNDRSVSIVRAR